MTKLWTRIDGKDAMQHIIYYPEIDEHVVDIEKCPCICTEMNGVVTHEVLHSASKKHRDH